MTKALFYIQLGNPQQIAFGHPFGTQSDWQCFDLDNHSDSTTMQYARRLLGESEKIMVIIRQQGNYESLGGIASFLDTILRQKKGMLTAYSLGPCTLPALMSKKLDLKERSLEQVIGLLF